MSDYILDQLRRRLASKAYWPDWRVEEAISKILEAARVVNPPSEVLEEVKGACRDPTDDPILALAVFVRADFIASYDKDLLDIGEFRGARILKSGPLVRLLKR